MAIKCPRCEKVKGKGKVRLRKFCGPCSGFVKKRENRVGIYIQTTQRGVYILTYEENS